MGRNNRPPRPYRNRSPRSKTGGSRPPRPNCSLNESNAGVPSSSQGSVAAALSYYTDDDIYSDLNTDFDTFAAPSSSLSVVRGEVSDDEDIVSSLWPPLDYQEHYAKGVYDRDVDELGSLEWLEILMDADNGVNCQSSETNCLSFQTSYLGTTAADSNSIVPENQTNEEDAVESSPQPVHPDSLELNDCSGKNRSSGTSNPYKLKRTFSNAEALCSQSSFATEYFSGMAEYIHKEKSPLDLPLSICRATWTSTSASGKNHHLESHNSHDGLDPDNYWKNCLVSDSKCSYQMIKPPDGTTASMSDELVMSQSVASLPEKGMIEENAAPASTLLSCGGEKSGPDNHKSKEKMCQGNYPFKTEKTFDYLSASDSDLLTPSKEISASLKDGFGEEITLSGSSLSLSEASWTSDSAGAQSLSLESHNSHVRFRINSFTVPEFFVEVPETASVGLLKKIVMEKATDKVRRGGHVGMVHQGKEIRDENEILCKTGVSHENKLDVILELEHSPAVHGSSPHSCTLQLPSGASQPLSWYLPSSSVVHDGTTNTTADSLLHNSDTNQKNFQDNYTLSECQTNMSIGNNTTTRAAIAFPAMNVDAPDYALLCQKNNSSEIMKHVAIDVNALNVGRVKKSKASRNMKRRKTEFFSISEVEALVQKVEELGTGRWQKIKQQAFGNDSRRTYMDLKDKWRSLVKTAKRPADERRGVLLRQELLDRVLAVETQKSHQLPMQQ